MDNIVNPGVYRINSNVTGKPSGLDYGVCYVIGAKYDLYKAQLAIGGSSMYIRRGLSNSNDFTNAPWMRCDNFGCNTPADLAALLGGYANEKLMYNLERVDLNDITCSNGKYNFYLVRSTCTNRPAPDGYMIIFKWLSEGFKTQIFFDPNNNDIYMRSTNSEGVWGDWVKKA